MSSLTLFKVLHISDGCHAEFDICNLISNLLLLINYSVFSLMILIGSGVSFKNDVSCTFHFNSDNLQKLYIVFFP